MKVRKGFVSNSSSSSFVCDLSGASYEGYDGEYECTYVQCENGHEFDADGENEVLAYLNDEGMDARWDLPADHCPICNGKAKPQLIKRMKGTLKHLGLTTDDLK